MDRSHERRVRLETLLSEQGLAAMTERFPGVVAERPLNTLSLSETGCLMSHRSLLGGLTDSENTVILEDDTCFSKDFGIKIKEISSLIDNSTFDIIFLGQTILFQDAEMHAKTIKVFLESRRNNKTLFLNAEDCYRFGSFAYVINKKSVSKINKLIDNLDLKRDAKSIDVLIRQWLRSKKLTGAITLPYLVGVDSNIETTINDRSKAFEHRLHCELVNLYINDNSQVVTGEWLDILNDEPNLQALAVCKIMYARLTQ